MYIPLGWPEAMCKFSPVIPMYKVIRVCWCQAFHSHATGPILAISHATGPFVRYVEMSVLVPGIFLYHDRYDNWKPKNRPPDVSTSRTFWTLKCNEYRETAFDAVVWRHQWRHRHMIYRLIHNLGRRIRICNQIWPILKIEELLKPKI